MTDFQDEFEPYLAEAMKDPRFARAYRWASLRLWLTAWLRGGRVNTASCENRPTED